MRLSLFSLILGFLSCSAAVLASTEKGVHVHASAADGANAADVASGAADAAETSKKQTNVEAKLEKEVGEMVMESEQKTKSLKGMLTTNSKAIAALTGLFKEVSRLTGAISEFEGQLRKCKEELATVKAQQSAGPENDAYFNSAASDPLAGAFFFQMKAEKAVAHATRVFSKIQKNQTGVSLLQRRHRVHRRSGNEEEDTEDGVSQGSSESDSSSTVDSSISFGLNTIGEGEEDMDSRLHSMDQSRRLNQVLPGMDPLEYGMYDFTGGHGVHIFDHDSLDPDVQRRRELAAVNQKTRERRYDSDAEMMNNADDD